MSLPFTLTGWKRFGSVVGDCWKSYFPPNPALWEPACFDYANDVPRIQIVAVGSDKFKAVCSCSLPFVKTAVVFYKGFLPEGSSKRLFCFSYASVLHTIVMRLHGRLGRKHRTHYTRGLKATSVGLATGKSQVHGGTRPVDKVNKPVMRTWGFLCLKQLKAWSGKDREALYPPLVEL